MKGKVSQQIIFRKRKWCFTNTSYPPPHFGFGKFSRFKAYYKTDAMPLLRPTLRNISWNL